MLTILGLGLGAYIAWSGLLAISHMPLALIGKEGMKPIQYNWARAFTAVFTVIQVAIILILVSELS